jgi:hypothetical protein
LTITKKVKKKKKKKFIMKIFLYINEKKIFKINKKFKKKKKKDILTIVVYNTDKNMFGTALSIEITN